MRRVLLIVLTCLVLALPPVAVASQVVVGGRVVKVTKWVGPARDAAAWGPVKATVWIRTVKQDGKLVSSRITRISILAPEDTPRSEVINDDARPLLVEGTLGAQSTEFDAISGATLTSEAYRESLKVALKRAGFIPR